MPLPRYSCIISLSNMEVHLMNEHDDQQLPDTREVILPEEASAEPTPEQAAGKAAAGRSF